mgnify:CR=1 FL=1
MNMEVWKINGIEFTTVVQFARLVKVTPPAVYRWVYIGMPVCKSTINTYLIPIAEALKWVENYRGKTW